MTLAVMNLRVNALEVDGIAVVVTVNPYSGPGVKSAYWGWRHTGGRWASCGCPFTAPADALRDAAKRLRMTVVDTNE